MISEPITEAHERIADEETEENPALQIADPFATHPVDEIEPAEPSEAYREASLRFLYLVGMILHEFEEFQNSTTYWAVAFGLGTIQCEGDSITSRAAKMGISRAALSKKITAFCNRNGLPASTYMKPLEAQQSYRFSRNDQLCLK